MPVEAGDSGLVNQAMVNGVEGQFQAIGNTELVENIVEVIFHRLFADEQFFAYFAIAKSLRDKLHDFFFAITEQGLLAALA